MLLSERGRTAVAAMPRNRILPETDGPFGMRGDRPAYPWEANDIASALGDLWNDDAADVEAQLTANFQTIIGATTNSKYRPLE